MYSVHIKHVVCTIHTVCTTHVQCTHKTCTVCAIHTVCTTHVQCTHKTCTVCTIHTQCVQHMHSALNTCTMCKHNLALIYSVSIWGNSEIYTLNNKKWSKNCKSSTICLGDVTGVIENIILTTTIKYWLYFEVNNHLSNSRFYINIEILIKWPYKWLHNMWLKIQSIYIKK
jgi:hypothetical protein